MKKTLLLVEDESIIALSNKSMLERYGYTIVPAGSGEQAIEIVDSRSDIDLILMDINLGAGIDGTEAAEQILKKHDIPIVFLSSHTEAEIVERTEKITSYGYVVKYSGMTILDTSIKMAFKLFEANKRVEAEREHLNITLNSIGDAVIATDISGNITRMNPIAEQLTGWNISEALNKPIFDIFNIINASTRERVENPISKVIKEGIIVGLANHTILISKTGQEYQIADSAAPIKDSFGKTIGMVLIFRDVSQEYKLIDAMEKSEKKYSSLFNSMLEGFALHEMVYNDNKEPIDYRFIDINPAFEKLAGVKKENVIGKTVREIFPQTEQIWIEKYGLVASSGQSLEFEQYSQQLGKHFHVSAFSPSPGQFASVFYDVTESKESHDKLLEVSTKDFLTKIYNRRYIYERMQSLSNEYVRTGKIFSVAIFDIDHFKKINDEFGHQAGDYVLAEMSRLIEKTLRSYDLFGRYGGEEFIIVFPETRKKSIYVKMNFILDIIQNTKFIYNNNEINLTFSCGIADGLDLREDYSIDKIIEIADARLYQAKEAGRNSIYIGEEQ